MSEMRELNERFHNLIFGITGCSANLAEQAADAITEYLEARTLSTSLDQEVQLLRRLVRKYADPFDVEPDDHALVLAIGTDDENGYRAALLAIREGVEAGGASTSVAAATSHARTAPGPVNCLLRLTMRRPIERQPTKCQRCGAVDRHGCIFFNADGSAKPL